METAEATFANEPTATAETQDVQISKKRKSAKKTCFSGQSENLTSKVIFKFTDEFRFKYLSFTSVFRYPSPKLNFRAKFKYSTQKSDFG